MPRKIILDCDTGIDDALAVHYALAHPEIEPVAFTSVFGNTDMELAAANTQRILDLCGQPDLPVAMGARDPLLSDFTRQADFVHGANSLGDIELPAPSKPPVAEHAADLIIRTIREHPGEITLCAVAPMANVAIALLKAPEIAGMVHEIVMMGGTLAQPGIQGVARPMVDANFHNDPEAAQIVLRSGAPIRLIGMDVTMKAILTSAMTAQIRGIGGAAATLMDIAGFYARSYAGMYPDLGGPALHDPLAVAACHASELLTFEAMRVDVELAGTLTRGQTIPDRRPQGMARANAQVAVDLDVPAFEALFLGTFGA